MKEKELPEVTPQQLAGFARLFVLWASFDSNQSVDCRIVQQMARRVGIVWTNPRFVREAWIVRDSNDSGMIQYKAGPNIEHGPNYSGA